MNCKHCGKEMTGRKRRYCDSPCREAAKKPAKRIRSLTYYYENRDTVLEKAKIRNIPLYRKASTLSKRICALFERMSDTRRIKFANYLLSKSKWANICGRHDVDDWLARYNSVENGFHFY